MVLTSFVEKIKVEVVRDERRRKVMLEMEGVWLLGFTMK